jgi:hypothetical protein
LQEACEKVKSLDDDFEYVFDNENIISVDDLDESEHNLIVFDDFVTDKPNFDKISELFIRGRKKNATLIFLTQSYFDTPKIIRLQCNYFCFWKLNDDRERSEIWKNHNFGLKKNEFVQIFEEATRDPFSFLFFDTIHKNSSYRIRKNLNQPIDILLA